LSILLAQHQFHPLVSLQPMPSLIVREGKDGVVLNVHVQPKAARTACIGIHGEALKIRIAAPPVGGAANRELIRFSQMNCRCRPQPCISSPARAADANGCGWREQPRSTS
jgi:hypothetical protein